MQNKLFEMLRQGKVALGLVNMYPAPGILEGMGKGWDFVWIDGQHGEMSYEPILHAVQTARGVGIETMIRVPSHDHGVLNTYADLAPAAVMIPMVNNRAEAEHVRDGLRFPPLGKRSYGGRRVIDLYGREYYRGRDLLAVAQIETPEAVKNAADIIRTEGIDCLFFGPDDMRVRLDIPIPTPVMESPPLIEALTLTAKAARDAGKFCAGVATDKPTFQKMVELGYQMIVGGGDIVFLRVMSAERLKGFRELLGTLTPPARISVAGGLY